MIRTRSLLLATVTLPAAFSLPAASGRQLCQTGAQKGSDTISRQLWLFFCFFSRYPMQSPMLLSSFHGDQDNALSLSHCSQGWWYSASLHDAFVWISIKRFLTLNRHSPAPKCTWGECWFQPSPRQGPSCRRQPAFPYPAILGPGILFQGTNLPGSYFLVLAAPIGTSKLSLISRFPIPVLYVSASLCGSVKTQLQVIGIPAQT